VLAPIRAKMNTITANLLTLLVYRFTIKA